MHEKKLDHHAEMFARERERYANCLFGLLNVNFIYFVHLIGGKAIETIYWFDNVYRSVIKLCNVLSV